MATGKRKVTTRKPATNLDPITRSSTGILARDYAGAADFMLEHLLSTSIGPRSRHTNT